MTDPDPTPNLTTLREYAHQLVALLDNPHPGRLLWEEALTHVLVAITAYVDDDR